MINTQKDIINMGCKISKNVPMINTKRDALVRKLG